VKLPDNRLVVKTR